MHMFSRERQISLVRIKIATNVLKYDMALEVGIFLH